MKNVNGYNIQYFDSYQKKLARLLKKKIKHCEDSINEWDNECGSGNDMSVSFRKVREELGVMLARLESKEDKNKFLTMELILVRI